ncbi:AraC family transcriptional regulator [Mangrovicoccus algicola]|uniref:Helix-turn-helix domain-containing protein n=1 Tax=Mangrovicoccus algicola TaxID=2771008 RepID=A0A8J6YZ40_9RHOB|nr:AraC family transcriptional regulator [Mangrovicoccus algicola]MBE3638453.1 helix-turn-helix domain-containing protein [Mangrovicoccus algicola]
MSKKALHPVAPLARLAQRAVGTDPEGLMRQAGLSAAVLDPGHPGLPAPAWIKVFAALAALEPAPDLPLRLAAELADRSAGAPARAFAASPDIATGLARLALFRPLSAPLRLGTTPLPGGGTGLVAAMSEADLPPVPPLLVFALAHATGLCRRHGGTLPVASAAILPGPAPLREAASDWFGCPVAPGPAARIDLPAAETARPLTGTTGAAWHDLEERLRRRLAEALPAAALSGRVGRALVELLPGGRAGADDVCQALGLSRRSLQRHLQEEGESFRAVLDRTRRTLALHYLREGALSAAEIGTLLAYRDPNSFYRAFFGWTGMTPGEARQRLAVVSAPPGRGQLGLGVDVA